MSGSMFNINNASRWLTEHEKEREKYRGEWIAVGYKRGKYAIVSHSMIFSRVLDSVSRMRDKVLVSNIPRKGILFLSSS
jgi:hypothetical protein